MTTENRKLDMSLDEIIRMDGIRGPRKFGTGQGGPMRRRGGAGGFGQNTDRRRYEPKRLNNSGGSYNNRSRPYGQHSQNNRFQSGGARNRPMNGVSRGYNRNATLHISNLAPTVNSEDIEELFSTFGVLLRSFVHYDQYGTSLGTAEVVFEHRSDAIEAKNKLNSVPLDGKPLRISLIDDDGDANDPFSSYLRSSNQRNGGGGYRNNNRDHQQNGRNNRSNGRPNNGGGRSNNRKPVSAEDLDREMDEWRMAVDEPVDTDTAANGVDAELDI